MAINLRTMDAGGECCPREALICLILTIIGWFPGMIYSCFIIHKQGQGTHASPPVLSSTPPNHITNTDDVTATSGAARQPMVDEPTLTNATLPVVVVVP